MSTKRRTDHLAWRRRGFVLAFLTPTLIAFASSISIRC